MQADRDFSPAEVGPESELASMLMDFDARVAQVKRQAFLPARALAAFDRAAAAVDRTKIRQLQRFVRAEAYWLADEPGFKYLDLPRYLADKARWLVALNLDQRSPLKILDLGVGGGHFPFLAQCHGHQALGIDMENDIYSRMLDVYGIERTVHTISPGTKLPVDGRFNLVTALQMTFNKIQGRSARGRKTPFWTQDEWQAFLDDLCRRLDYPAQIFLGLNRQPASDGRGDHADELMALFERHGAVVDRKKYSVLFDLKEPLTLAA
jgi:SAM-dependent methyltransferase